MDTSCKSAMAASLAGGYLLGRTKKAKLALGLAMFLSGRRLKLSPADLAAAGMRQLSENPQLAGLRDQVRDELFGAVKTAASAAMDRQVSTLTGSLRERTAAPSGKAGNQGSDREADEGADEQQEEPEQRAEDEASEKQEPDTQAHGSARSGGGRKDSGHRSDGERKRAGGSPGRESKRTPAKRTPAKSTAAKRAVAGSADAHRSRSTRSGR